MSLFSPDAGAVPLSFGAIAEIEENFALLQDWDERYRYVIELGRNLPRMTEHERTEPNKVRGCASQVWLAACVVRDGGASVLHFSGDSDAHIVRGLVAILLALVSGRSPEEILAADPIALFERMGLGEHLTPQRSNGFRSMVDRVRRDAQAAASASLL